MGRGQCLPQLIDHLNSGVGAERDLFGFVVGMLIELALVVVLLDHRLEVSAVLGLLFLLLLLLLLLELLLVELVLLLVLAVLMVLVVVLMAEVLIEVGGDGFADAVASPKSHGLQVLERR